MQTEAFSLHDLSCVPQSAQIGAGSQEPPLPPPQNLLEEVHVPHAAQVPPLPCVLHICGMVQNRQLLPGFLTSASYLRHAGWLQVPHSVLSGLHGRVTQEIYTGWLPSKGTHGKHCCGCFTAVDVLRMAFGVDVSIGVRPEALVSQGGYSA